MFAEGVLVPDLSPLRASELFPETSPLLEIIPRGRSGGNDGDRLISSFVLMTPMMTLTTKTISRRILNSLLLAMMIS